jgi:cobalt/nickel transport system permease protein
MHMSDALLSPTIGATFLAASGGVLAYSAHRLGRQPDERRVPLMGVLGAFVFAAQMINFSIPGTGSSGHLGGGMLLAILLGPCAAFVVISSVLVVQCLFFLDGGMLALGANVFNLGLWPCFLGLLIYRAIAGRQPTAGRLWLATMVAVVVSLELGALGVVVQTVLSRRTELPFGRFALLMMGIHFPIALIEGAVTSAVVQYVRSLRPGLVGAGERWSQPGASPVPAPETLAPVVVSFLGAAILVAGVLAWFASPRPDGLEWALAHARKADRGAESPPAPWFAKLQKKLALMPDYELPRGTEHRPAGAQSGESSENSWPTVRPGTSVAGLLGAALTFAVVCVVAAALYWFRPRRHKPAT